MVAQFLSCLLFLVAMIKYTDKSNLGEKRSTPSPSSRLLSSLQRSHNTSREQGKLVQGSTYVVVPPSSSEGLPICQLNWKKKISYQLNYSWWRFSSQVIPKRAKMTINSRHPSLQAWVEAETTYQGAKEWTELCKCSTWMHIGRTSVGQNEQDLQTWVEPK